jgi:large subunit ribosomal protein L4
MKRAAIHSILTQKLQDEKMIVVEDFTIESGRTRDMNALMRSLTDATKVVLITKDDDPMLKRAARNIPWLRYLTWNRLRAHDLFYAHQVVIMESAAKSLGGLVEEVNNES